MAKNDIVVAKCALQQELDGEDPDLTFCVAPEGDRLVARYLPGVDGDGVYIWDALMGIWSWEEDVPRPPTPGSGLRRWWSAARRLAWGFGRQLPLEPTAEGRQAHEADMSAYWFVREKVS